MKRKFTLLIAALALLTMIVQPGKAWGQTTHTIGWGTASGDPGTYTNFTTTSGNVNGILSFTTAKNSSSSNPAYNANNSELRLYYNSGGDGGSITIEPVQGLTITSAVMTTSTAPSVKYYVDGGDGVSISATNNTYTITGISASESLEIQNANTTNTQLRILTIEITYTTSGGTLNPCDLALTNAPVELTFDLYNNSDPQVIHYTTSSTGEVTVEDSDYITAVVDQNNKTITVTPVVITNGIKTITINQAADDDYYSGSTTFTVNITDSTPSTGGDVTFNATEDMGTSPLVKNGVTFACNSGVLNNGSEYRLYKNSVTTFSVPDGYSITQIAFTGVSGNPASGFATQAGWTTNGNDGTWVGSATSVSFTASGAQVRATVIVVSVTAPSTDPYITADDVNLTYDAMAGSIEYEIHNVPTPAGTLTATTTDTWLTIGAVGETIPLTCDVNATADSRTATVTLTYTYGDNQTATKDVTVTQAGNPNVITAISDIDLTASGTFYRVQGTILAKSNNAFVIGDNTGYVYTYKSTSYAVNDNVIVAGTMGEYGHVIQFTSSAEISYSENSNYDGEPAVEVITTVPNYTEGLHLSTYFQYEGSLSKVTVNNKTLYLVAVGESSICISYPSEAQTTTLESLLNKTVRVKGYFAGINSSDYFTTIMESIEEVTTPVITIDPETAEQFTYVYGNGPSEDQPFEVTGNNLTSNDIFATITAGTEYFEVTDNEEYGTSVTIASGDFIAVRMKAGLAIGSYEGTLTLTNEGAEDVVVALTGTVTGATYNIVIDDSVEGGTIAADKETAQAGETVTLTANPADGFDFTSWNVEDKDENPISVSGTTTGTFTMPAKDVLVSATFTEKTKYEISLVYDGTQGLVGTDPEDEAYEGQTVEIIVAPETGFALNELTATYVDGESVEQELTISSTNTFEMPAYPVTVTATFEVFLNAVYDFTSNYNFYTEQGGDEHPGTSSSNPIDEFYYGNGDEFTASGTNHYFSASTNGYFMLGKSGALLNLPTFNDYKVTQIIIHSSTGHSQQVRVAIADDNGDQITDAQLWSIRDHDYTYDIPTQYQKSALSVKVTNGNNTQITSITLVREVISTDPAIEAEDVAIAHDATFGAINYNIENQTTDGVLSAEITDGNEGNWLTLGTVTVGEPVPFTCTANTGDERSATVTLTYTYNNGTENVTATATVTQAEYDVDFATLPFTYTDDQVIDPGITDLPTGLTASDDLGAYTSASSTPRLKFADTDCWLILKLNEAPTSLSYDIKGNGFNGGTFDVEVSANGLTYTTLASYNTLASTTRTFTHIDIADDVRYIRWIYTNKNSGNVALGNIRATEAYDIFGQATVDNLNLDSESCIIYNGGILNVTSSLVNNIGPDGLIIEDGGQLIVNNSVAASVKKNITAPSTWDPESESTDGWYTISSPIGDVEIAGVNGLQAAPAATVPQYDLYSYDEEHITWYNSQGTEHGFTELISGMGYLYAKNNNETVTFAGEVNVNSVDLTLTHHGNSSYAGFNLIGNPFAQNITMDNISGIELAGGYVLTNAGGWKTSLDTEIKPCQGFMVQVNEETPIAINRIPSNKSRANRDYIAFTVANSEYEDVTYALFSKGLGLDKISHRNSQIPMVYIPQNGTNYAIATMDDNIEMFNLNFKAMTTGQYTLSFDTKGNYSYLHVIDRLTGEDIDMLLDGEYTFIGSPRDNEARFIVKLNYNASIDELSTDEIFAYQYGSDIIVNGNGELQVFDATGRMVMNTNVNGIQTVNVPTTGMYIFRVVGDNVKTQKIVVR